MILMILTLVTGCMGNDDHETHVSRGETDNWQVTIQTTFSNDSGKEEVHTEGGLEFKQDYSPKEVQYKITYPSGESGGSMRRGKKINIQSAGGSRSNFAESDIEKFADEMTFYVSWENEEGNVIEETIPLE
ncbi:hypothetical protein [Planococcus halotolerans]|nr:hypothetical protein [Planococcus halotolerans]